MKPIVPKKIALIGAGQMAEALLRGLLASGVASRESLFATDPSEARRIRMAQAFNIRTGPDNREAASWANVVVLAVKPQMLDAVLLELVPFLSGRLIISIVAGVPIGRLAARLPTGTRIARIMPNAPAMVGEGMSAVTFGATALPEDRELVTGMFTSVGKVAVVEEHLMDAVTGLSGSGPAYVFIAIEALADAGVKMGLSRSIAEILAAQTMLGAARTVLETGEHPGRLKDRVTSPGGTTIAGLHQLEQGRLRATLMAAVKAATMRAEEMGRSCLS